MMNPTLRAAPTQCVTGLAKIPWPSHKREHSDFFLEERDEESCAYKVGGLDYCFVFLQLVDGKMLAGTGICFEWFLFVSGWLVACRRHAPCGSNSFLPAFPSCHVGNPRRVASGERRPESDAGEFEKYFLTCCTW